MDKKEELIPYKIKKLPREKDGSLSKSFMANGHKYKILGWEDGISMDRWQVYQQLSIQGGFDLTFQKLYDELIKLRDMFDAGFIGQFRPSKFNAQLNALIDGVKSKATERVPKMMRLAAVFIVRENEDVRYYSESIASDKINDWQEEGYDVQDFFTIALNSIQGWGQVLQSIMGDG